MSNTNLNSSEDVLKMRLKGLVFINVRFDACTNKFEVRKCRLLEPVYILSMKIFKGKNEGFILKEQNDALIEDAGQPEFRDDFQSYLQQISCESLEEFEDRLVSERRDRSMQQERDSRQSGNLLLSQQQNFNSLDPEQQLRDSHMKQIVAVLNDDRSLDDIYKNILETKNSHNIIELGYNMNLNVFHYFKEFFNRFSKIVKSITEVEKNKSNPQQNNDNNNNRASQPRQAFSSQGPSQTTSYSSIDKESLLDEMKLILKNRSKFLLFDSLKYQQDTYQYKNQPQQTYELESSPQHHNFYIVAASHFSQFNKLAEHLHYYHKSSPFIIYRNIQESLLRSAYKTLKDILRLPSWESLTNNRSLDPYSMLIKLTSDSDLPEQNNLKKLKEYAANYSQSLIYKNICAQGLLPVNLYLSTNVEKKHFRNFFLAFLKKFIYDSPFNYQFHLSIQIMNKFYSFNAGSFYSCTKIADLERKINQEQLYTKIRIIDFFPLDTWVTRLSDKLKGIIDTIQSSFFDAPMQKYFDASRIIQKEKESAASFVRASLLGFLKKGLWQEIKIISAEFLLEYFKELRFFQKWAIIHAQSEQKYSNFSQNCFSGGSQFLSHIQQIFMQFSEPGEAVTDGEFQRCYRQFLEQQLDNNNNNNNNRNGSDQLISMEQTVKAAIMKRKVNIFNTFSSPKINQLLFLKLNIEPCDFKCVAPMLQFFCEESHVKYLNVVFAGVAHMKYQVQMAHSHVNQKLHKSEFSKIREQFQNIFSSVFSDENNQPNTNIQQSQTSSSVLSEPQNTSLEISNLIGIYDSFLFQRHQQKNYNQQRFSFCEDRDILKELCYYYYNSVRLASDALLKTDTSFSLVGHLIIKNPAKKSEKFFTINGRKEGRSQSDQTINYIRNNEFK